MERSTIKLEVSLINKIKEIQALYRVPMAFPGHKYGYDKELYALLIEETPP